ncbi:LemA family protein [Leptothrix discophora]|uniref:LemA family protein n=1 Tax=Leptothrix discophora TaxID=89 RepID=A0ABT9G5U1_LEPDI|nr:LemA family protein [Leptothrix discophora]MDP4301842.1 LemA family protein [Leptothrix discophora]
MPSTLAWALFLAVLGFWMLGAHNRLVRLRHTMRSAYAPLSSALRQRHAVALTLAETSRSRMADAPQADLVDAAAGAARRAGHACDQVQLKSLRGDVLQQLAVAEERLVAMLEELGLALQDLTSGDGPDPAISDLLRQRDQLQEQIAFSRQVYNRAADDYNQAIALFPTTLVANLLRFHRAPEFPPI